MCRFDHSESNHCEHFSVHGNCSKKMCDKRHVYACKHLKTVGGCFRGNDCAFNHDVKGTKVESDDESSVDEQKKDELKSKELLGNEEDVKNDEAIEVDNGSVIGTDKALNKESAIEITKEPGEALDVTIENDVDEKVWTIFIQN